jgi:hypothetical protein
METSEPLNDDAVQPEQEAVVSGQNPTAEQSSEPPGQVSQHQEQATLHPEQRAAAETSALSNEDIVPSPQATEQSKEQTVVSEQNLGPDPGPEPPKTTAVAPVQPTAQPAETSEHPKEAVGSSQQAQRSPVKTKKPTPMSDAKGKLTSLFRPKQSQSKSNPTQGADGAPQQGMSGTTPGEINEQISEGEAQKARVEDSKKVCRSR